MPAEASGVEFERHPGCECQLADLELSPVGPGPSKPGRNLLSRRRPHERVVKRPSIAVEHGPISARHPDQDGARPVDGAGFVMLHAE